MSDKPESWIRLLVKYRGKCKECGKEIPAGEYALWSRVSKAIKHVKCETAGGPEKGMVSEDKTPRSAKQAAAPKAPIMVSDCFVCGKPVGCAECGLPEGCSESAITQACICDDCLSDKNAYENYQDKFVKKMQKVAKVKI